MHLVIFLVPNVKFLIKLNSDEKKEKLNYFYFSKILHRNDQKIEKLNWHLAA